jgi:hypothetical protein
MYVRRKKTKKALVPDTALLVSKGQAISGYKEVKAEIRKEILRSKKKTLRYSKYS